MASRYVLMQYRLCGLDRMLDLLEDPREMLSTTASIRANRQSIAGDSTIAGADTIVVIEDGRRGGGTGKGLAKRLRQSALGSRNRAAVSRGRGDAVATPAAARHR